MNNNQFVNLNLGLQTEQAILFAKVTNLEYFASVLFVISFNKCFLHNIQTGCILLDNNV